MLFITVTLSVKNQISLKIVPNKLPVHAAEETTPHLEPRRSCIVEHGMYRHECHVMFLFLK